jgi:hypothetical protein
MMKEVVGKGLLGQLGVGGILVVLILQIVLPWVAGSAPDQAMHKMTIDGKSVRCAVEPLFKAIETAMVDLVYENEKQCDADVVAAEARTKLIEVITALSHQQEMTANAMSTMQRQLERMERP